MPDAVVSLNSGSSSIKFALFELETGAPRHVAAGKIERIGSDPQAWRARVAQACMTPLCGWRSFRPAAE